MNTLTDTPTAPTNDTGIDQIAELESLAHSYTVEAARLRASAHNVLPMLADAYRRRAAELELLAHVHELKAEAWSWSTESSMVAA